MFKTDSQWMTITNPTQSSSANTNPTDKISNLIEAFTSNLDAESGKEAATTETYKVNGQIGTFIAQKMLKGEKIRIGHNGEPVKGSGYDEATDKRRFLPTFAYLNSNYLFQLNFNLEETQLKCFWKKPLKQRMPFYRGMIRYKKQNIRS
jgi:hypothetical protein